MCLINVAINKCTAAWPKFLDFLIFQKKIGGGGVRDFMCFVLRNIDDDTLIHCERIIRSLSNKCSNNVIIMDLRCVV
jgi:hypothetical protein